MSNYFDNLAREVASANERALSDRQFIRWVSDIEHRVFEDVTAITGDLEFPNDLREAILATFVIKGVWQPDRAPPCRGAVEWALSIRSSGLVEAMHDLFRKVAERRVETRFGLLSNDPLENTARRNRHDSCVHSNVRAHIHEVIGVLRKIAQAPSRHGLNSAAELLAECADDAKKLLERLEA